MPTSPSLIQSFFRRYLIGVILSILIVGSLWFYASQQRLQAEITSLREKTAENQLSELKERVEHVVNMISDARTQIDRRIRSDIKQRTLEAFSVANNIYQQYQADHSRQEIAEIVRSTLRPIRYNAGRGYFFAVDMQGVEQLLAVRSEFEGASMLEARDSNGRPVVRDMLELIRSQGEGFYEYTWSKPGVDGNHHKKIAYIKYFAPLDWFIGTGEYLADVIADVQAETIRRTELNHSQKDYVFIGNFQGVAQTAPAKGRDMLQVEDANGLKIVQELIRLAQAGGGYLRYVMPAFEGQRPELKVSYVQAIPEWQWYVGSGDFVADLDQELAARVDQQKEKNRQILTAILLVLTLLLLLGFFLSRKLGRQIQQGFQTFQNFFDRAAFQAEPIDTDQQAFSEFKTLAQSANLMLEQRQQHEHEARQYRDQLSAVINSMPSVLITLDQKYLVKQWNQTACAETGISSKDAAGQPVGKLLPYLQQYLQQIRQKVQTEHGYFQTSLRIEQDGSMRIKEVAAYPLGGSQVTGIVIRIDDVTHRVKLEELIVQSEKMLSVGGLAAGMAHEINNPLAGIMQNIQLARLRMTADNPKSQQLAEELGLDLQVVGNYLEARGIPKMLDTALETSRRAAQIVENMLNFSRGSQAARSSVNLPELLDKTIELIANDYNLKKNYDFKAIRIERDYAPDMPQLSCEPSKIQQVIFNLLKNGAEAMVDGKIPKEQRKFTLRLEHTTDSAVIIIEDSGPGIPAAVRERIFEPFFTTKKVGLGTGLGLSVSYFIITENHGGSMRVESAAGGGARFVIEIPLQQNPSPD